MSCAKSAVHLGRCRSPGQCPATFRMRRPLKIQGKALQRAQIASALLTLVQGSTWCHILMLLAPWGSISMCMCSRGNIWQCLWDSASISATRLGCPLGLAFIGLPALDVRRLRADFRRDIRSVVLKTAQCPSDLAKQHCLGR